MLRSLYIKRFLAGFLLVTFALSITPKKFLHDAFATHNDQKHNNNRGHDLQINNAGYNCDNDNQVAESAFETNHTIFSFPIFFSYPNYISKDFPFSSTLGIYSSLRGPPVNI